LEIFMKSKIVHQLKYIKKTNRENDVQDLPIQNIIHIYETILYYKYLSYIKQ